MLAINFRRPSLRMFYLHSVLLILVCCRWHGRLARLSCRRSTPWLGGVTFVDRRRSIRQQPRRVALRATSESVSDPGLVRAAASHRGTAAAAPSMGPLRRAGSEASRLCWLCGSAGMSETCFILVGSASAGGDPPTVAFARGDGRGDLHRTEPHSRSVTAFTRPCLAFKEDGARWMTPRPRLLMGSVEGPANGVLMLAARVAR